MSDQRWILKIEKYDCRAVQGEKEVRIEGNMQKK